MKTATDTFKAMEHKNVACTGLREEPDVPRHCNEDKETVERLCVTQEQALADFRALHEQLIARLYAKDKEITSRYRPLEQRELARIQSLNEQLQVLIHKMDHFLSHRTLTKALHQCNV